MDERPTLYCLVARISADGWVTLLTREKYPLMALDDAVAMRESDATLRILIDPMDEIALANYERRQLPINQPRWWQRGQGPPCNGE